MVSGFIAGSAPVIIADAARIVRGLRNGRVSVCLSVCPVDRRRSLAAARAQAADNRAMLQVPELRLRVALC